MQLNHLDWPECLNARDLGGLPAARGEIRAKALVRSDNHGYLTDDGAAAVRAYGVSRIIDLRREVECAREPSPFADTTMYLHLPVQNPADPDEDKDGLDLAEIYRRLLDRRPSLFANAVTAIAEAPPGAVAVHCAGGKDRTGLVVALALSLAGVEPEVVAADYAVTEQRLQSRDAAVLAGIDDAERRELVRKLQATRPETMLAVLEHLDSKHGGVSSFLTAAGCAAPTQAAVRERLLAG